MPGLRAKLALGLLAFVAAFILVLYVVTGLLRIAFWAILVLAALALLAAARRKGRRTAP